MIVLPDAEDFHLDETLWNVTDKQTDRRTDRQTDLPWLLQRSALRAMRTRCKNRYG